MARNPLKTPEDIRKKLKKLYDDVEKGLYEGKMQEARLMMNILGEMLRSIRTDELEKQLNEIEQAIEDMKEGKNHEENK